MPALRQPGLRTPPAACFAEHAALGRLAWAAQYGAHSSRLSTVAAAGTPGGLLTTVKSGLSATMRSCGRGVAVELPHARRRAGQLD